MILKASQRAGAKALAVHLLNTTDNEHVTVHELKGVVSDDVVGAFKEMQAVAKGTRCKKHLLSLSLNPPEHENASIADFENAITRIEDELKLTDQPRAVILHEKEGRRHAHCVWSRIDDNEMKAIKLPYFKKRLNGIARDLYIDYGWDLPRGFISPTLTNPLNFTLAEWQQAKRHNADPKEIKHTIQQCWKTSDNKAAFKSALEEKGFFLAKGDRRGFVVMDWRGEVYSLARSLSMKAKEVKARLQSADDLPSVDETRNQIADNYTALHQRFSKVLRARHDFEAIPLNEKRTALREEQRKAREVQNAELAKRSAQEQQQRQAKIKKGIAGLWNWVTGKSKKQHKQNEIEAKQAKLRDQQEREALVSQQLAHRKALQQELQQLRQRQQQEQSELSTELQSGLSPELQEKIQQSQQHGISL